MIGFKLSQLGPERATYVARWLHLFEDLESIEHPSGREVS